MWEVIKEGFLNFLSSSFVTKILLFISAFFAPVWELYILLLFLVIFDFIIDFTDYLINFRKTKKSWDITQPFVIKVIMYSILVISVNAVQQHLIKDSFEFFKLVVAIPIIAELLGIIGTVERVTGVAIVDKVKNYLENWISSKAPKEDK